MSPRKLRLSIASLQSEYARLKARGDRSGAASVWSELNRLVTLKMRRDREARLRRRAA